MLSAVFEGPGVWETGRLSRISCLCKCHNQRASVDDGIRAPHHRMPLRGKTFSPFERERHEKFDALT